MPLPSLILNVIKAVPALALSSAMVLSGSLQSLAQAQSLTGTIDGAPASIEGGTVTSGETVSGETDLTLLAGTYFRRPRNSKSRSRSRTTTGTRQGSCLGTADTPFTVLGPDADIGQTKASHPTFVWYLPASETAYPVRFRLLAPNEDGIPAPVHTAELAYTTGFVSYELPTTLPALESGKEYRWQVVVDCNPNYPSRSPSQELSFEVVPSPAGLSPALAAAQTAADTALAYGQSGLWYEAIAQVAEATTAEAQAARTGLLQNLAELESENAELSEAISAIAETTAP